MPANPRCVRIVIAGISHVPSFKNSKMIARGRLITLPARQKWMEQAIRVIESQLRSGSAISEGAISTGPCPLSWIASSLPADDSWQWIPEIRVQVQRVTKGQEGAEILIERL